MCMYCGPLIKAIDAYIKKADDGLSDELDEQGYTEPKKTVEYIQDIEDGVAEALLEETDYILSEAEKAIDLETFAEDVWPGVKLKDTLKEKLAMVFFENFEKFMPEFIEYYLVQTDRDLKLTQISKRTTAWIEEWAEELGEIMKLNSHKEIEDILSKGLKNGDGIATFTQNILDSGIRDEYYKARRVAVTEVLTAHRAAQQEAFTQSPAVSEKMWKHTGSYRNEPRQNHVDMDGQRVPVDDPFVLTGADGGIYYPMYPGDTMLPASERINCHCIQQPVVDKDILGLSFEERQQLQQQAIDEMDEEWENELNARNRAKAGIEIKPYARDISRKYDRNATPGKGKIAYEDGYPAAARKSEAKFAQKIHDQFGGDITLLNDQRARPKNIKSPDYKWKGRYWELKEPQSSKTNATSDNFRTAKNQIKTNPGGVILNYNDDEFDADKVEKDLLQRFSRKDFDLRMVDVMICKNDEMIKLLRFEK